MKKAYFTSFVTILLLTFISVAYAAFSSDLKITGEASVLKDTVPPTCGSWYLRESSLTTQEAFDQNKFINAGTNTTWTNTNKTLFIECSDNLDGDYGCINVDTVTTSAGGKRYFKDVKNYTTSIKTDGNAVTVTLKDAYQNERTCTLPVGGSNPYVDKQGPTVTITRTAANKFTYSATDDMSSVVTTQYMVTTSSTQPSINDSGWSSTASEVTIDQTASKNYYVWAKDGVNITHQTISTYKLTKTQGTGTTLTLKYNNNSGAELNTSYVLAGTPVYVTASANNGYGSLVLKKDSTSISSGSTQTITGATTISSSATPNTYTITYDANGGTGAPAPQDFTFNAGESISTTVPTRTGYTFINWKYGSTTFNPGDTIPSGWGSFTLTAQWSAKTYTLNLNKNDGTGAGTTSLTATYDSSTLTPTTMSLASKSFTISGFGTAAARKSDGATVSSTSTLTSTATLNGYYTASTGGSLILAANTTPTFNNASVSGYLSSGAWVRDANTTLYAQFGAMPSKTLPTITKTGYTCGWTTSESGTSIQYQSGGNLIPTGNTTLYGVCVPASYTIAYTMNNGNDPSPKPTSGTYNSDITIGTTSAPTKSVTITGNANSTGATVGSATINTQVFAGWSSSSGAGLGSGAKTGTSASPSTAWNGSATTNKYYKNLRDTSGTVTLTANWGGSSTLPTVTKTGYTCSWYDTNGTSGGNYIGSSGGSYTVPSGSSTAITVYARCTPNVYTITLNQQSGSGGTGTIYEKYDDGYYLTYSSGAVSNKMSTSANGVTVPTRTGYTFGGYYTSTGGAGTQYIDANGKLTSSASASQFSSSTNTLYAKWTINQYTVTCKDYFVDSSNNLKVLLGSSTKSLDYGSSVSGATWGTTTTTSTYYGSYSYHGSSAATTVPANNDLVVYRYFYAWTDLNIYYASGSSQSGATVEFKVGSGSWADVTNESNTIQPWGTTYYVRNIRPKNATEEFSHVNANLVWDSTNQYYSYTPTAAGTSMNIYMKYKVYTITLDKQSGSGGTGTIYEKYNTGYYTDSSATTQMTTSANPVSVPSRTGYTFGGYYTSTGGAGTQFIDANGKLTSSASSTQFSANGSLYAKWTANSYTVVYNKSNSNETGTLPSNQSATYDTAFTLGSNSMSRPNSGNSDSYTLTFLKGTASSAAPSAITNTKYYSYTANGWATSANGSQAYTSGQTNVKNLTATAGGTYNLYTSWSATTHQNAITLPAAATKNNTNLGTVTFKYQDSATADTTSTAYNTYAFSGWYDAETGGNKLGNAGASYTPNASKNVYPQFTATAHSATFPTPTRDGYTFSGWFTAETGGTQVTTYTGSSNVTYYAHWTGNTYYVYYNQGLATGGWSTSTYATQSRTFPGSTTLRTNSMTKTATAANSYTVSYNKGTATGGWDATTYGAQTSIDTTIYTANGWSTGSTNLNDRDYANGASYGANSTANLTLYPNFSTSTTNGGVTTRTNSMTKSNSADSNSYTLTFKQGDASSAAPGAITNTKYTSYTANGWTTTSGSTSRTYANNTSTGALTGNITLYPCFSETVNQKSITLPAAATKNNTNLGTVTFKYQDNATADTTSTAYNTYAFKGWYTASSGGTKLGDANASYTPNASIDVYPQFTATAHSATFPSPTRTGYTFAGWYDASSGGNKVTSYTGSSNVTYYAHWTPNTYTIAYTMNNGTDPNPKPTSGTYNSNVSIGTTSIPTKTVTIIGNANGTGATVGSAKVNALTFNGWSSSSGAGLQENAQSGSTTSNFAAWNGGTTTNKYFKNLRNSSGTVTLTANWSTTVTLPTLSKTGHTCSWYDTEGTSGGNQFTTTISQNASTSITIYARCTANTYNITLNQQNGSGGTATIYEKYGDGYYLTNNNGTLSNKMSTSANGVTIPTRSGYTFGGYYTSTNGGGTQYIDANGKLTSSASATQFSSAGNLYAKWTVSVPATPTISGGATKVYGSSATTLTCASSTTYPSGMTKKYQFGYATSDGGTPGNWTTESDSNTIVIAANAYLGQRWYSCRVRVYDGSSYTGYSTSAANADTEMTINNATLTFNANGGTGGGTVYTRTGQSVVFSGIRNSTTTSIPSPGTRTVNGESYGFEGWYDAASGGNKILEVDGMFTGTAVSGYSTVSTWATTSNKTLYAHWSPPVIVTLNYNHTQDWEFEPVDPDTLQTRKDFEIFTSPTGNAVSRIYDSSITYKFEAWGAQGGASVNDGVVADRTHELYAGGQGAYAAGYLSIPKTETKQFYVFVGERPESIAGGKSDNPGGWNGGGLGRWDRSDNDSSGGGGGATDFRYFGSSVPSTVQDIHNPMDAVSLRYRVLVAGGGGGNGWASIRGHAGALQSRVVGNISTITSGQTKLSSLTEANSSQFFGQGGQGGAGTTSTGTGGGGGGWYGGAGGNGPTSGARPGNGGSSYVSGYTGCVAVASASSNTKRTGTNGAECTDPTVAVSTDNLCSVSFTGIVFSNPVIYAGWEDMPTIDGDEDNPTMNGNLRHGFARVSIENARIKVTTGSSVGDIPAPFDGGSVVYRLDEDDEGNQIEIPYEIDWHDANDEPISSNSIYSASNGTTWTAYGYRPVEYSVTYSGLTLLELRAINNPTSYNAELGLILANPEDRAGETEYYQFTGWSGTDITGTSSSVSVARGETGNRSYTANWTQKTSFNVTYNANGGTTSCTTSTGSYKGNWSLCSSGATRSGYTFKGWYTDQYGGTKVTSGGIYDKDYTLYAHWESDVKKVEYVYNINAGVEAGYYNKFPGDDYSAQRFGQNTFIDTYYTPNWSKTFEFKVTLNPKWQASRYLVIGNYDGTSSNSLNIEINTSNQLVVYVGTGFVTYSFGSVPYNQESIINISWNGTTQLLTIDISGGGSGHDETVITELTGTAKKSMRIGSKDYRTNATVFGQNAVKNLVISQVYAAPLSETITVPDPAGHYLLFDGWTGANGDTPQYNLTVPTGSTGVVTYQANWSKGVSMLIDKKSEKTFGTSNEDIFFKLQIVVQYIDQARRHAYTRERVYFYRKNYDYSTYGQGSMTVKYNGTSYTVSTADKHITKSGITMWSRYWDNRSETYDSLTYDSTGNYTVTFKMTKFTHAMFTITNLPKTLNYKLPSIKPAD